MAGSSISVSYDELQGAAARLESQKQTIIGELDRARSQIAELVGGGFVTQHASGKFNTATEQFVTGSQRAMEGLADLGQYLRQTASALQQVDQELASRIG
ncbi:WXG100 family type VII secretion target [Pseudoclavibacter sp. 13-3]|uniref:WXG100 family type VII secretion target n=1 Tax=Pseudoclavibacter sp. 13-3 TaxID=2901228 RepID=UPI001E565C42|nr:WXG100 family type VII secretion target [Pseudoclavibacter sp. 13-3]MCD7101838.1 WXG100 family type VII secretion target [Pseudoclavibacter sp. 13-3]